MDEPLAALDAKRKCEILPYFQRLQSELRIPVFYVTHSLNEVLQLVDTMLLMDQGKIIAAGPVANVFSHPEIGVHVGHSLVGSVLDTIVNRQDIDFQLTVLKFKDQTLYVPRRDVTIGSRLRVHIRAEDVALAVAPIQDQTSVLNVLAARVLDTSPSPEDDCKVEVRLDIGCPLLATITRKSLAHLNLQPGQNVYAHIKAIRMTHELD
jgi:molybdate transport system ATP-binding protein